jgi:hypothetical protein
MLASFSSCQLESHLLAEGNPLLRLYLIGYRSSGTELANNVTVLQVGDDPRP